MYGENLGNGEGDGTRWKVRKGERRRKKEERHRLLSTRRGFEISGWVVRTCGSNERKEVSRAFREDSLCVRESDSPSRSSNDSSP